MGPSRGSLKAFCLNRIWPRLHSVGWMKRDVLYQEGDGEMSRRIVALILVLGGAGLALVPMACDDDSTAPDYSRPAAVTLSTASVTSSSITLMWLAPGDDGTEGRASVYDLRYSETPNLVANWWDSVATPFEGEPRPALPGEIDSITVGDLAPATTYYFALRTGDEVPNWSAISNVHEETTLP